MLINDQIQRGWERVQILGSENHKMHQAFGLPGTILNTRAGLSWPGKCRRASGATGVPGRMQWVLINKCRCNRRFWNWKIQTCLGNWLDSHTAFRSTTHLLCELRCVYTVQLHLRWQRGWIAPQINAQNSTCMDLLWVQTDEASKCLSIATGYLYQPG